jgi:SAV_6107-like HEPN
MTATTLDVPIPGVSIPGVPIPGVPAPRRGPGPARSSRGAPPPIAAAPTSRSALMLLRQAADGLAEAHREPDPLQRYPLAYLAALRAAAAVLAVRTAPRPRRGSTRNVWQLLSVVAPELAEWAAFFASCSDTRAAAEAGIARLVGRRDADDLLRQAEQFIGSVRSVVPVH